MVQNKPDIFACFVGNIPPGETITIRIRYVTEIAGEGEKSRFVLPTLVAPRYTPAASVPDIEPMETQGSTSNPGEGSTATDTTTEGSGAQPGLPPSTVAAPTTAPVNQESSALFKVLRRSRFVTERR